MKSSYNRSKPRKIITIFYSAQQIISNTSISFPRTQSFVKKVFINLDFASFQSFLDELLFSNPPYCDYEIESFE